MSASGNGAKPHKSSEQVATELRERLERELGRDRTEAIWRDPTSIQEVVHDENEAASVAGIILEAWKDLPPEERSGRSRRSGFRRGLQLALVAAIAVWAFSLLNRTRQAQEPE